MVIFRLFAVIIFLFCATEFAIGEDPVVTTGNGDVRGKVAVADDTTEQIEVQEFLGIPFAKPPLNELRFVPPQPPDPWDTVYNATSLPNTCYQADATFQDVPDDVQSLLTNTDLSEDCLYLNIWTPNPRPQKAAVLVWIYGGGFSSGSSSIDWYDGKILAGVNNVVVVSMQYRVGALGFLSLFVEGAPGNAGLFDQQLAIKWVHDNIEAFGGDQDRITLFGESAGGASVSHHLLSDGTTPYFTRAIMESGTSNTHWAIATVDNAKAQAIQLAASLGCPTDESNPDSIVTCLRAANAANVSSNLERAEFIPVMDGAFFKDYPQTLIANGDFYETEILLGINTNEGSMFLGLIEPQIFPWHDDFTVTEQQYQVAMGSLFANHLNPIQIEAATFQYRNWDRPEESDELIAGVDGAFSDTWFLCPTTELADVYTNAAMKAYVYFFTHRSSFSFFPQWFGVAHTEEISYVFGLPLRNWTGATAEEKTLSRNVMTYWTNFAKTGEPNVSDEGTDVTVHWPERTTVGQEYLELTIESSGGVVGQGPRNTQCAFWAWYIPKLHNATTDVPPPCPDVDNGADSNIMHLPYYIITTVIAIYLVK